MTGDVLLAVTAHQGGSVKNMTPPAGWTAVPNTDWFQGTNARIHAWFKIAGPAEPASYTFALVGSGDDMSGGILDIGSASQAAPIDASGGQSNGTTSSTSVTAPSITTISPSALLIFGGACASTGAFTPPTGMTEQWDAASSGTYKVATETANQQLVVAGPTGTRVATFAGGCRSVAIQVAVAPAG
jgi:hypothetical protein